MSRYLRHILHDNLKALASKQDGAVAVIVSLMLGILFTSVAVTVGLGAAKNEQIISKTAAEVFALEAARACQTGVIQGSCNLTDSASIGQIRNYLAGLGVAEAYGIKPAEIVVSTLSSDTLDSITGMPRSKVSITVSRKVFIPMSEFFGRASNSLDSANATASWTSLGTIGGFAKKTYLPLFLNDCVVSSLLTASANPVVVKDNEPCSTNLGPKAWWFGNAGGAVDSCYINNTGQDLLLGDKIANSSTGAMPTPENCTVGKTYFVPVFNKYMPAETRMVYDKSWNWSYTQTISGKPVAKTVSTSATCTESDANPLSASCTPQLTGFPKDLTTCKTKDCTFGSYQQILPYLTRTEVLNPAYGLVTRFIKVQLLDLSRDQPARPDHIFKLGYAGHDIRLIPN